MELRATHHLKLVTSSQIAIMVRFAGAHAPYAMMSFVRPVQFKIVR